MSDPRLAMSIDDAIARGVAAFAAGRWHEALDEFEVPYHRSSGAERGLWLGLVRAAGALLHHEAGRAGSYRHLLRLAEDAFDEVGEHAGGFDLATLRADLALVTEAPLGSARPRLVRAL